MYIFRRFFFSFEKGIERLEELLILMMTYHVDDFLTF